MKESLSRELLKDLFTCSDVSISPSLPYRATIRDKTYGHLIDVESRAMSDCVDFVDGLTNVTIVVSPCKKK